MFTAAEIGRRRAWVAAALRMGVLLWGLYLAVTSLPVVVVELIEAPPWSMRGALGALAWLLAQVAIGAAVLLMERRIAAWVWPMPRELKGECPECKYPRPKGATICPECGATW